MFTPVKLLLSWGEGLPNFFQKYSFAYVLFVCLFVFFLIYCNFILLFDLNSEPTLKINNSY